MNPAFHHPRSVQEAAITATAVFAGDSSLYPFLDAWIDPLIPESDFRTTYFSEAAFYHEMTAGRHSLVNFVRNHLADVSYPPRAWMDALSEQGLISFVDLGVFGLFKTHPGSGKTFEWISSETGLAYSSPDKPSAYQLAGDISSPLNLVFHTCDLVQWENTNISFVRLITEQLLTHPIIWIGGDLRDPLFRQWHHLLTGQVGKFSQPQVVILPETASPEIRASWAGENVEIFNASPEMASVTTHALAYLLREKQQTHSLVDSDILRKRPYKFLDYFSEGDHDLFFGREQKIKSLYADVMKAPLLLLYGPSGIGKTSLLRAGLRPSLADGGISSTYIRPGINQSDIRMELEKIREEAGDRPSVVILDQAEELFTQFASEEREYLLSEITDLLASNNERIHVVISFREDFLGSFLSWLKRTLPIYVENVRLAPLSVFEARQAIERPAEKAGITIEPKVVDFILEELDDDGIIPSQLQIVCDQLYEQRDIANVIRLKQYESAGRASGILNDYLQIALQRFHRPDQDKAQAILRALVNSSGWRSQCSKSDIQMRTKLSQGEIDLLLSELVESRLVHSLEQAGMQLYELTHDILAAHFQQWIDASRQRALEIAQLLAPDMDVQRGVDVDLGKEKISKISLELNNPHLQLSRDQVGNILPSTLRYGITVSDWVRRGVDVGIDVWAILEPALSSNDESLRRYAVNGLAGVPGPRAMSHLTGFMRDSSPSVRVTAHQVLFRMGTPDAMELLDHSEFLRLVPAGSFLMGRPKGIIYAIKEYLIKQKVNFPGPWILVWNESPAHTVNLPAYFVGRTPVTRREYMAFMQAGGYNNPDFWTKAGWSWRIANNHEQPALWIDERYADPDFPVIGVTWYEAIAYAHWAGCRLLTEAEWEKAGRGTDGRHFPWGNQFDKSLSNTREGGVGGLTQVGQYSPQGDSPFGVADLSGNVWEWTNSIYKPYPYNPDDGREDLEDGDMRVPRGGSWSWMRTNARLVCRGNDAPDYASQNMGFRCGADAEAGG